MTNYHPGEIESKWLKKWRLIPKAAKGAKKFYALVEFPYPSGSGLHMGHAFTMTILDILARKKRLEGFNVLYPMGWDAFGLPTENYAIKTGIQPAEATAQNTKRFKKQMQRLGLAYNWEREVNTSDPDYYRWTQWIFLQLFKHGLAYKKQMPVGWCPSCKVILANEEIVDGQCERCGAQAKRRLQSQWLLRITAYADRLVDDLDEVDYPDYVKASQKNWIGRTQGVVIDYPVVGKSTLISCYSTRPDTNFGATFVVMAPEHPLVLPLTSEKQREAVKKYIKRSQSKSELERTELGKRKTGVFTGSYALNRLTGKKMPIWVADFVVATAGTGIVVGVPAHDERDWQFAQKYDLKIMPVVKPLDGEKEWDFAKAPFTDIDHAVVFNSDFLDGLPALQAKEKIIDYLVGKGWGRRATNYHLRDWIFSRQHYWGEPIPMISCKKCGWQPVDEKDLPVKLPKIKKYQPTDTGESPLANVKDWIKTTCPKCGGPARRETDTMPNWAGSSWYFLRYTDPHNGEALADPARLRDWLPVDLYLGGAEHTTLHLLYSRFWYKFLNDIQAVPGQEPYAARRQHGVILGEDGEKMSKSRGNVVTPDDVVQKFGADTLRLYLMFMGPYEQTMPWSSRGVEGIWRFLNRVWRLVYSADETDLGCAEHSLGRRLDEPLTPQGCERQLDRLMHQTIKKVSEDIEALKHNTAIAAIMEYTNGMMAHKKIPAKYLEILVLLLSPFAPFMTEELWHEALGKKTSIHQQAWPKYDANLLKQEQVTIVVQINGKVRGQIIVRPAEAKGSQLQIESLAKKQPNVAHHLAGKKIAKVVFVPGKLINFVV